MILSSVDVDNRYVAAAAAVTVPAAIIVVAADIEPLRLADRGQGWLLLLLHNCRLGLLDVGGILL